MGAWGVRPDWRTYQSHLKRKKRSGKTARWIMACGLLGLLAGVTAYGLTDGPATNATYLSASEKKPNSKPSETDISTPKKSIEKKASRTEPGSRRVPTSLVSSDSSIPRSVPQSVPQLVPQSVPMIDKIDVQAILKDKPFLNLEEKSFDYSFDGHRFHVDTSLDPDLQKYLSGILQPEHSRFIGIVVMDPRTGRVLGMTGYDRENPLHNPCTDSIFPAASVFKIVTAAAAIEKCGFESDSTVSFSGKKYTLYKNQIKKDPKGWVRRLTLRDSFAQSVNPVFGKLGAHFVGKTGLETYAEAFGFNRPIPFELPVTPSRVSIRDAAPYQWAEIASGFNRRTTISPLHGAVMVSAIAAGGGALVEPAIVDRIRNENGETLYSFQPACLNRALSRDAAAVIKNLMRETIESGTCRKTFRGFREDPILSRLNIGGKTGSINSRIHSGRRFDWFVGFAEDRDGSEQIVLSIAVAHEKFIGIRSQQYARMAIEEYFRKYFSKKTYAGTHAEGDEKG